jgi:hypothetical protein
MKMRKIGTENSRKGRRWKASRTCGNVLSIRLHFVFFFLVAPTHLGACSRFWSIGLFLQFLNQGQSVGLLGRVISSSQGLYLYTNTEKHTHTYTNTNIHALSGIRTHGPGFRASEDSARLRPVTGYILCSVQQIGTSFWGLRGGYS